jgi:hypothetical protein
MRVLVGIAAVLLWAKPALADGLLDVTVVDREARIPLVEAKVRAAGPEATVDVPTDAEGKARLRLPAGQYKVTVEHERYAADSRTVRVAEGTTVPLAFALDLFRPWMFQTPPGWRLGMSPVFVGMWNGDLHVDSVTEQVPALNLSRTAPSAALSAMNNRNHDLQIVGADLQMKLGLPSVGVGVGRLYFGLTLGAGGVTFRQDISSPPSLFQGVQDKYQLTGLGFFGVAEGAATWALADWYLRLKGHGEFIPQAGTGRDNPLNATSGNFSYTRAAADATVGRTFLGQQIGLYAGVGNSWTWVNVEEFYPFPGPAGTRLQRTMSLSANRLQGIAGADFQWAPGRFGGNFEWRFDLQDRFISVGVTYLF